MYVTLESAKKHLNLDDSFNDDDSYISLLIQAAEDAVSKHIDLPLVELEDSQGELPPAILHSILLLIGNLYAVREPVTFSSAAKVPYTLDYLLGLHKHYFFP